MNTTLNKLIKKQKNFTPILKTYQNKKIIKLTWKEIECPFQLIYKKNNLELIPAQSQPHIHSNQKILFQENLKELIQNKKSIIHQLVKNNIKNSPKHILY